MRKINRRDYLLQMGAGTAGLIAALELPLVGQTRRRPAKKRQTQSGGRTAAMTESLKWQTTAVEPDLDAFITVIYAGLSGFAYNSNGFVDVLFHPGTGRHKLQIQIYKNPLTTGCREPVKVSEPARHERLRFTAFGGTPKVFQADSNDFNRNSTDQKYAHDFRWMPDLNSRDFYPEAYSLNHVPGTRLSVPMGTFYTRVRTNSTFWLVNDDNCNVIRDYGHIALYMATAINASSDVSLLNQNGDLVWRFETGNKYQVVFYNECDECDHPAPHGCDEEKRNDFHFNRGLVNVPSGKVKYGLKVKVPCPETECAEPNFCIKRVHRFTDQAPCSGAGYGKAPGFP